jgi:hypothetical protein
VAGVLDAQVQVETLEVDTPELLLPSSLPRFAVPENSNTTIAHPTAEPLFIVTVVPVPQFVEIQTAISGCEAEPSAVAFVDAEAIFVHACDVRADSVIAEFSASDCATTTS